MLKASLTAIIVSTFICSATLLHAETCPRQGTLGTARILTVDPVTTPRVGTQSFPDTLALNDHEVVLTFDDGPNAPTTSKILAALSRECVRATFFLVGQNALANTQLVKRMVTEGHTIGHHTWSHANLGRVSHAVAIDQIDRGIAADETALNGKAASVPTTPFFRFPYFESTPELLALLQSRKIAVFGADFWASDWNKMTPQQELELVTGRLKAAGKGIILFHDTKAQTAAMLPDFLRYLRDNGYRVVHIVGSGALSSGAVMPSPAGAAARNSP